MNTTQQHTSVARHLSHVSFALTLSSPPRLPFTPAPSPPRRRGLPLSCANTSPRCVSGEALVPSTLLDFDSSTPLTLRRCWGPSISLRVPNPNQPSPPPPLSDFAIHLSPERLRRCSSTRNSGRACDHASTTDHRCSRVVPHCTLEAVAQHLGARRAGSGRRL